MLELDYQNPTSLEAAIAIMAQGDARALAAGTDLIVQLKENRRTASRIVDLKNLLELVGLKREPSGSWRIGAAASVI